MGVISVLKMSVATANGFAIHIGLMSPVKINFIILLYVTIILQQNTQALYVA